MTLVEIRYLAQCLNKSTDKNTTPYDSMPFIAFGHQYFFHARTHAHERRGCACFHSTVHFFGIANLLPQKLRTMCSDCAQHIFWIRFRSADDTDAHRLITGLLPEQHWMVAAERRVRSDCCQNRRISHGSRTRMLFYLYPHKRMTASKQPYTENFQLYLWRGGVIEIFC